MEYLNSLLPTIIGYFTPGVITTIFVVAALLIIIDKIQKLFKVVVVVGIGVFAYLYFT